MDRRKAIALWCRPIGPDAARKVTKVTLRPRCSAFPCVSCTPGTAGRSAKRRRGEIDRFKEQWGSWHDFGVVGQRKERRGNIPKRSEEHTSELQSLMRISYAVFCLKKKKHKQNNR